MAWTRDFEETIPARAKRGPAFRKALLPEGAKTFSPVMWKPAKSYCALVPKNL